MAIMRIATLVLYIFAIRLKVRAYLRLIAVIRGFYKLELRDML